MQLGHILLWWHGPPRPLQTIVGMCCETCLASFSALVFFFKAVGDNFDVSEDGQPS